MNSIQSMIEKAKKGDQSSFYALYNDTLQRNRYIALKYMKQEFDANDVLQDAYIRIFNNLDKFTYNGEGSFQSWTSKIVSNTALNHLRKKNPILFSETENDEGESIIWDIEDDRTESQPELSFEKNEVSEIVNELLNELSEEQRIVVMMYYYQEYSVKEIAAECSCNENTVKSRLNYARKKLETKATDLRKKGILTTAFTMSALFILLRDDSARAAVGSAVDKIFGAVWNGISGVGGATISGAGGTAISCAGHVFTAKLVAIISASAVLGAGVITGVFWAGGFFSNGQSKNDNPIDSVPAVTSTPMPTSSSDPTIMPIQDAAASSEPDISPEPTSEAADEPEKTEKPRRTRKPRRTPRPTREPAPQRTRAPENPPETADWDEDSTDWDGGDTDWDDDFTDWDD